MVWFKPDVQHMIYSRLCIALLLAGLAAAHPLDPLSREEITATVSILRSEGKITSKSSFPLLVLREPAKKDLLTSPREASVIVFERARQQTFEGVVDLTGRRVVSWTEVKGVQPPLMFEDFALTDKLVRASPEWQAAIRKRGITNLEKVQVDAWSAGYHGELDDKLGHRLTRAASYYRGDAKTAFTRPIEGVVAFVDLTSRRVQRVMDTGVVPLAPANTDLEKAPESSLPMLDITQPKGTGFTLKGQEVTWGNWRFRYAMHPREGLVLYTVGYLDQGRLRTILYRGSLSEMLIPYGDPGPAWYFRNVFDTGEYSFVGRAVTPLVGGKDVPGNATVLDAVFAGEEGKAYKSSRAVALYVRDGGLLWRYSDLQHDRSESRRAQELVLACIITAGNYEYGFNWVFHEDGRLEMEVLLTGIMITKGIAPATDHTAMQHGHRVSKNLEAIHHQHFFNFRLDMDVDGAEGNSVVELDTAPAGDPYHKGIVMKETVLQKEGGAKRQLDLSAARKWKVVNTSHKNALGEPVGYLLVPGENSVPYASPASWIRKRAGFINAHLWVTPYDFSQMNAAGTYVNQSQGNDGLPAWTAKNRPIENTDVVLWYTLGITHIPRPEEWPVMPVHKAGFQLVPTGFFSHNPTLDDHRQ
jgi:primary-amine oxidase